MDITCVTLLGEKNIHTTFSHSDHAQNSKTILCAYSVSQQAMG